MKRRLLLLLVLFGLADRIGPAMAQSNSRDLPPEERRELRQQMREHWQQRPDLRQGGGERRQWQDVPQEDRQRMREEIRQQRALLQPGGSAAAPGNAPGRGARPGGRRN